MKKFIAPLILSTLLTTTFASSSNAESEVSANISVTSNYLWRGLEQTNGKAAISGGLDYVATNGFYLGTWTSNADWDEAMTYELDIYAGYSSNIEEVTYDIGFIQYAYPDASNDVDFSEVYLNLSYSYFTLSYNTLLNAEGADFADDTYISLSGEFELANKAVIAAHIGKGTDDFYAGESFVDYGVSLSKSDFTIGLSKTDLNESDVKVFVSYSLSFDL